MQETVYTAKSPLQGRSIASSANLSRRRAKITDNMVPESGSLKFKWFAAAKLATKSLRVEGRKQLRSCP